eukprot:5409708-Amphidinium_carterae.1
MFTRPWKLGCCWEQTVDLAEAWNPERTGRRVKAFGLTPGVAVDMRSGWDLSNEAAEGSYLLILAGSTQHRSMIATNSLRHLTFACKLMEGQLMRGGKILFEHPWDSGDWNTPCVREVLRSQFIAVCEM